MIRCFFGKIWMGKKTKYTNSVIDRNKYNSFLSHSFSVINRNSGSATRKATSINPYKDRFFVSLRKTGPYIQIKTVFTDGFFRYEKLRCINHKGNRLSLHGAGSETFTFSNTQP